MEGVELEYREDALTAIAPRRALERRTGARGLRSILEQVLLDIMFDLPSLTNVEKVVVDEGCITGDTKPLLIYADQPKVAGCALIVTDGGRRGRRAWFLRGGRARRGAHDVAGSFEHLSVRCSPMPRREHSLFR